MIQKRKYSYRVSNDSIEDKVVKKLNFDGKIQDVTKPLKEIPNHKKIVLRKSLIRRL
jgi:hypothetical protein